MQNSWAWVTADARMPPNTFYDMKTELTKEDLANDLLLDTLQAIDATLAQSRTEYYIVGALARDLAMKMLDIQSSKRKTSDLDIAIAIRDWDQFYEISHILEMNHFKKLKSKQKFAYKGADGKNDYEVDIVPFGEVADDEKIKWPPEMEPEMSVRCYLDVMAHAVEISLEGIRLKIAPLAGQFLIKLDTWIDRNDRENKDAIDMTYFLGNYYQALAFTADSIPDEVDVEEDKIGSNMLIGGAQWIACDVTKMLSTEHLKYYRDILAHEISQREDSRLLQHLTMGHEDDKGYWNEMTYAIVAMCNIWDKELKARTDNDT